MKNSPAYSFIKERLEKEFDSFTKEKITPWAFLRTDHGLEVTAFDGTKIKYQGIEFDGSPRQVFWKNFAQPFLRDIISRGFAETRAFCNEHGIEGIRPPEETASQLKAGVSSVFERMVDIDRRLRGKGNPNSVDPYNPHSEISHINSFIEERLQAEICLLPKSKSRLNQFYEEQKFWIWLIGILLTLIGLAAKFMG